MSDDKVLNTKKAASAPTLICEKCNGVYFNRFSQKDFDTYMGVESCSCSSNDLYSAGDRKNRK